MTVEAQEMLQANEYLIQTYATGLNEAHAQAGLDGSEPLEPNLF